MRERTDADDIVQGAYNRALLDLIIGPMRKAAKDAGYALTIHGSLQRDIDLVAVAWVERDVAHPDELITSIAGAARGVIGRCNVQVEREGGLRVTHKPHGRRAYTLVVWCGENSATLDVSVVPALDFREKTQSYKAET